MTDWHPLGPHRFRYQNEILHFEPHGALTLLHIDAWLDIIAAHFQQQPHGILMVDARELAPPPAEVRKRFLAWIKQCQVKPRVVSFNVSLVIRAASRLVLSAARQLYGYEMDVTVCSTEEEAWGHVQRLRRESQTAA